MVSVARHLDAATHTAICSHAFPLPWLLGLPLGATLTLSRTMPLPSGLFEMASKEEKASEAGMLQCIADMEKLQVDVAGVANVTIGEILEREPELRAEIEEEIKNNVWAP